MPDSKPLPPPAKAPPMPRRHTVILWTYVAVGLVCFADMILRRTELISSISTPFLLAMLCVGALLGTVPVILLFYQARASRNAGVKPRNSTLSLAMALIAFVCIWTMVSGYVATRLTEVYDFWGSDAVAAPVTYPITSFHMSHGPQVSLYHGLLTLPISFADEKLIRASPPPHRPWAYCLSVLQQQEGTAVRIVLPPRPHRNVQSIVPCPRSLAWLP